MRLKRSKRYCLSKKRVAKSFIFFLGGVKMLARYQVENDKSVAASQTANTKNVDLEPCRKFSLLVVPDATHTFSVSEGAAVAVNIWEGK